MKHSPFLLAVAVLTSGSLLSSCESSNEVVTMFLAPHKAACGESDLCLLVREEDDEAYRLMDHIGGFRFRWGYDYELRVELKRQKNLGPTTYEHVLDEVERRDEVPGGTRFELCMVTGMLGFLDLERNRGWMGDENREFDFAEEIEAQVVAFQEKGFGLASFEFREDVDDPLILTGMSTDLEAPCEGPIPDVVPESPGGDPPAS